MLQTRLRHNLVGAHTQKLEHVGITDGQCCGRVLDATVDHRRELLLVAGEPRALVVEAGDLALELAHRPGAANALELVESAFERIVDCGQQLEVAV